MKRKIDDIKEIIENDSLENKSDNSEFNEHEYVSGLSEVAEEKTKQKNEDNEKVEELKNILLDKKSVYENEKRLILEITGEGDIDVDRLDKILTQLTEEDLMSIKENKNLIVEIIGQKISFGNLYFKGDILKKVEKEDLERIKENKNLILEISGEGKIDINDLENLIELTKQELEIVKENKDLILEISGEEKINIRHLHKLSKITKEGLENIKRNIYLITRITGKKISGSDLYIYGDDLSELTKEDLKNIVENKDLILEITGEEKIHIRDLKDLSKFTKKEFENIRNNKDLVLEITGKEKIYIEELKDLIELTKQELEIVKENKDLILEITGKEKIYMSNLKKLSKLTNEEFENIKNNKALILEITGEEEIYIGDLKDLSKFTKKEFENIRNNKDLVLEITGKKGIGVDYFEYLCQQLTDRSIDYCNDKNIKELWMIIMVDRIIKNSSKIRDYIKRKQEYLKNNELIDDSKFKELFGGNGKYGKGEINQGGLGYCYLYTAYEILKKMNYFDVFIKTSLRESESGDGRYVKLPMGQPDGDWIYVSKNDIDKKFDIPDKEEGLREGVSINSDSPLGFKIMEIAYVKKELMDRDDNINKEFLETGDITLTGERLHDLEGYNTVFALSTLIGDNNIINQNASEIKNEQNIDVVFDNFGKGLIVDLSVKREEGDNNEVKLNRRGKTSTQVLEKNVKIINRDKSVPIVKSAFVKKDDIFELINKENRSDDMLGDIIDIDDNKQAIFYRKHAYSLERCYVDKNTGEKRVWVVNPWHTGIKFDISLESAKKIFDWTVSYIDIDKLFR